MKLKTIFKNSDFLKVNNILTRYYYKKQVHIIKFFKATSQAKPEKGSQYNYLLFLKNAPSSLQEISFEEFEELFIQHQSSFLKNTLKKYKNIFNEVIDKPDFESEYTIVLKKDKEEIEPNNIINYIDVFGIKDNESNEESHALEFLPWSEWSNMTVSSDTINRFSFEEICAHTLYEMTFFGFNENEIEEIKNETDKILKRIDQQISEQEKDKT